MMLQVGSVPPRCRRFIYSYALDHSEFPCYLLWPCRNQGVLACRYHHRWLLQAVHRNLLSTFGTASLLCFFAQRKSKPETGCARPVPVGASDLRLTAAAVLRMQWSQHEEQPKAPPPRTARRDRVPQGVIVPEQEEEEQGDQEEEA